MKQKLYYGEGNDSLLITPDFGLHLMNVMIFIRRDYRGCCEIWSSSSKLSVQFRYVLFLLNSRLKLTSKEKLPELPNPSNISSLELRRKVRLFVDLAEVITNRLGLMPTNVFLTWPSDYQLFRTLKVL